MMIAWQLHSPPGTRTPLWLDEISELRGRVLYDGGRRPGFRSADGRFVDRDPFDSTAYHIAVRCNRQIVGCVRLVALAERMTGLTERLLGPDRFAAMLRTLNVARREAGECGRWVVDPDYRVSRFGVHLAGSAAAAAKALGFKIVVCPVGTRGRQDQILLRLGLRPVPDLPLIPAVGFDDDVRVMYFDPDSASPRMGEMMISMAAELGLTPDASTDRVTQAVQDGAADNGCQLIFRASTSQRTAAAAKLGHSKHLTIGAA